MAEGDQGGQGGQQGGQQQGGQQGGGQQQTTPWHTGVEPEVLGHWQNKGYDVTDPKKVATELTKAARAAEQHFGVPADRLLKLPADLKDEAGWKGIWQRLGAPADAKDYDFAAVKDAAGNPIDARLADTIRATAASANLPKDAAAAIAAAVVKHQDEIRAAENATNTAKLADEKAALKANWGTNFDFNHLKAMEGARRAGVSPEGVALLEKQMGYSAVMEHFRKIGAGTSEDMFVDGGKGGGAMTQQGAIARLQELQGDSQGWAKRLLAGDPATRREFDDLSKLASGYSEAA